MPSIPLHGMERANIQIMRTLKRAGADVHFIAEATWGEEVRLAIEQIGCTWSGVQVGEVVRFPRSLPEVFSIPRFWLKTYRQFRRIFDNYKPTHLYFTNVSFFLLGFPLADRENVTTFFRLPNPPADERNRLRGLWNQLIWKKVVAPRTDVFICNSEYAQRRLKAELAGDPDVRLIPNMLPTRESFSGGKSPVADPDRRNLIYIGQIRPEKGVAYIFDAAVQLINEYPDLDVYIVGDHEWNNPFAQDLIRRSEKNGIGDRIKFTGYVNDVDALLKAGTIHVCFSISKGESFPNVILEAKNAGIPSIVSPIAGLAEAVRNDIEGIVCEVCSVDALVSAAKRYLDNEELRRHHGAYAKQSLSRYEADRVSAIWVELFEESP